MRPLLLLLILFVIFSSVIDGSLALAEAIELVDDVGRHVTLRAPPKRIVSLAPNVTEILFALGLDHEIVGVCNQSDYPKAATTKSRVGNYVSPDLEKIVSLKPDLVVATGIGNKRELVNRLQTLGITTYVIFPKNFADILKSIENLGELVDRKTEASTITSRMKDRALYIGRHVAGLRRPRVFLQVADSPIITVGKGSFADDLIHLAGGQNIAAGEKQMYPRLSLEEILLRSPEVIVISTMISSEAAGKIVNGWRRWNTIPAVRNNKIHLVNSDLLDRPSPRIADGLDLLAKIFHPEAFPAGSHPYSRSPKSTEKE